ncbi:MAG: CBS domain-containing protein [Candidatus Desulfofervidaceae bacterium]|nr:CBS domain-containing protein [Candidatus Desulfofervidaceae bacterium]
MPIKLNILVKELFKVSKSTLNNLIGIKLGLDYKKGPQGDIDTIREIVWPGAFVTQVKVNGIAEEDFWFWIEKKGAIFLSAQMLLLPQKTMEDALSKEEWNESMEDAQREICNMLVGVIDDIFREKVDGSWHLSQGESFLYDPTGELFLPPKTYVTYIAEIKAGDGISFQMAFAISEELVAKIEGREETETVSKETQEAPQEEPTQPTPEKTETPPAEDILSNLSLKDTHGLTAEAIAEKDFPAVHPEATLGEALKKMQENNSEYLFVVDGLKLLGIITITDIKSGLSPFLEEPFREYCRPQDEATRKFKVSWFIHSDVPTVAPETSLLEVAKIAAKQFLFSIPVCVRGRIIGEIPISKLIAVLVKLAFGPEEQELPVQVAQKEVPVTSKIAF